MRTEHRVRDQSDVIHNTHICPDAFSQVLPSCATKDETLDTTHTHSCVNVDWECCLVSLSPHGHPSLLTVQPLSVYISVCWVTEMVYTVITLNCPLFSAWRACHGVTIFHMGNDKDFWPNQSFLSLSFLYSRNKLIKPVHGSCFLFTLLQLRLFYRNISTKHKK